MHSLVADRRAFDEPRDEVALGPDECGHLGAHAHAGRGDRRGVLDLAADAKQVRVVAGQADDVALAVTRDRDQEVPVRDAPGQGCQHEGTARELGDSAHRPDQVVAQLPAQFLVRVLGLLRHATAWGPAAC